MQPVAAMDRFAAIGTLGLSGREQYIEMAEHPAPTFRRVVAAVWTE